MLIIDDEILFIIIKISQQRILLGTKQFNNVKWLNNSLLRRRTSISATTSYPIFIRILVTLISRLIEKYTELKATLFRL